MRGRGLSDEVSRWLHSSNGARQIMGIKQEKGETSHRQRPAVSLGADGAGDGLPGLQGGEQQREEGGNKGRERCRILQSG